MAGTILAGLCLAARVKRLVHASCVCNWQYVSYLYIHYSGWTAGHMPGQSTGNEHTYSTAAECFNKHFKTTQSFLPWPMDRCSK